MATYLRPRVVDDHVRETMQTILDEIQSGKFAEEWVAESKGGRKNFLHLEAAWSKSSDRKNW